MFAGTSCPHEEVADPIYPDRSNSFCFLCNSTLTPTIVGTAPPSWSVSTGKAFKTNDELRQAVDEYMIDDSPSSYTAFQYGYPIGVWDVSLITDFSHIFDSNRNNNLLRFNADLSGWNVSNAVSMYAMFQQAVSFTDATNGLASWDVSKVTDMSGMFASSAFSGNISAWQVGRVTDFSFFADFASSFTGDLSMWNVSSAQDMSWMFRASKSFNSNISNWDVSSVIDFSSMYVFET
jgi:surface protein